MRIGGKKSGDDWKEERRREKKYVYKGCCNGLIIRYCRLRRSYERRNWEERKEGDDRWLKKKNR